MRWRSMGIRIIKELVKVACCWLLVWRDELQPLSKLREALQYGE